MTRLVQCTQNFLKMLSDIVFLIEHQHVQQLSRLDTCAHYPVSKVSHHARQDLGEVVVDQSATAEI